jgi:hypothetical protein
VSFCSPRALLGRGQRPAAEEMIWELREDEPLLAEDLPVEAIEL